MHTLGHRRYPTAAEHTPITHHLSPSYQLAENPRFVDKKHINSYQSKSSFRLKKSILIGTNQNHRFVEKKNILIVTNQNHRFVEKKHINSYQSKSSFEKCGYAEKWWFP